MRYRLVALSLTMCSVLASGRPQQTAGALPRQPELGHRSVPLLTVDGLQFKDLDRNGKLDPYEDWRLTAGQRAADLVARMSLEELAGLMVHGTLPSFGPLGQLGVGKEYDLEKLRLTISNQHVSTFITRLSVSADQFAKENNEVQALAESSRWGVPAILSSDPRHHFEKVLGASTVDDTFSHWPEPPGFAAINDESLTRRFGDIVRQEYAAVGIRESLAPQADLATDPRWARANGTFGEDSEMVKRMVFAYVSGIQAGSDGLNPGSVIAVVKHWAGYGATKDGWDSHNYYGRFASFPGNNFQQHLIPFVGAFDAHVASVMPTYSILQDLSIDGNPLEQVGAGFNHQLLSGLLRGKYGFTGVIVSDWEITADCDQACHQGAPAGSAPGPEDIGMPWGTEKLTILERFAKSINAGVDQIGGTDRSELIVEAVKKGLIQETRVREAALRILVQKFEIGVFEQPYVDVQRAQSIAGNTAFMREGQQAQWKAVVLLQNNPKKGSIHPLLPLAPGSRVYLYDIAPEAAQKAGFTVVTDAAQADVAIIHAPAPYQVEHPNYFFGSRQHEGRLAFNEQDPAYAALLRVSESVPTLFVTTLERPLILTNVVSHSSAVLADFGITDEPLMELIIGKVSPVAHLPFELPSSAEAVKQQKSDLPHDSKEPLFPIGFGLSYAQ